VAHSFKMLLLRAVKLALLF